MDKNLYGVSAQVIAPGVLVFRHILGELMRGYADPAKTATQTFARAPLRDPILGSTKPGAAEGRTG